MRRPVTVLVATHYPELKAFAHSTPGARNASVEFDVETLRPTYRLTVGLPGRSNALAIAERLGLDRSIIENAEAMLSPDELQVGSLLDEIHHEREAARSALAEAEAAREGARDLHAKLAGRLEAIEEERRALLEKARADAGDELEAVRQELAQLRRRLAAAGQPLGALREIEEDLGSLEASVEAPVERDAALGARVARPVRLGDRVRLTALRTDGIVTSLGEGQLEVQVGRLRVRARLDEVSWPDEAPAPARKGRGSTAEAARGRAPRAIAAAPPLELDLRGTPVDEALVELERRLDAAFLAGLPFVRVIHGKGTGRLRQAIREALQGNTYVAAFDAGQPSEGGDGVTVVRIQHD
jgi:DNA mismatch repair protein MutS2